MKFNNPLFAQPPQFKQIVMIATDGVRLFKMFGEIDEHNELIILTKLNNLKPLYIYNVYPKIPGYALAS